MEEAYAQTKFMEYCKKVDISVQANIAGTGTTKPPAMQQLEPSSLFDMLPESVVQDSILPYVGPCCHECKKRVYFPVGSDGKVPLVGKNVEYAVCVEEVIRNCTIHDPNQIFVKDHNGIRLTGTKWKSILQNVPLNSYSY